MTIYGNGMQLLKQTLPSKGKCKDMTKDSKDGKDCKDDICPIPYDIYHHKDDQP